MWLLLKYRNPNTVQCTQYVLLCHHQGSSACGGKTSKLFHVYIFQKINQKKLDISKFSGHSPPQFLFIYLGIHGIWFATVPLLYTIIYRLQDTVSFKCFDFKATVVIHQQKESSGSVQSLFSL